jgi:hypothetical protein
MITRRRLLELLGAAALVPLLPSIDFPVISYPIQFVSDGSMPEGLLEGVTYYVTAIGPNSFSIDV